MSFPNDDPRIAAFAQRYGSVNQSIAQFVQQQINQFDEDGYENPYADLIYQQIMDTYEQCEEDDLRDEMEPIANELEALAMDIEEGEPGVFLTYDATQRFHISNTNENIFKIDLLRKSKAVRNELNDAYESWIRKKILKAQFKNQITEELIASAMSPSRIQKKMDSFEDMEAFFDSL